MSDNKVLGVVLAGGQSRRMGQDKAGLDFQGKSLLAHMQSLLRQSGVAQCCVAGPQDIADRQPGLGPLAGLDAVLAHPISDDVSAILLVPVDMPLLTPEVLSALLPAATHNQAARHYANYPMPLLLPTGPLTHQALQQTLAKPGRERSLKNLLRNLHVEILDLPSGTDCFINANTPSQWQACLANTD